VFILYTGYEATEAKQLEVMRNRLLFTSSTKSDNKRFINEFKKFFFAGELVPVWRFFFVYRKK